MHLQIRNQFYQITFITVFKVIIKLFIILIK